MDLTSKFRHVLGFPKEGIDFIDITTVLQDAEAFHFAVEALCRALADIDFDLIVSSESRGFILGAPVAYALGKGFVPVRKPGKLPYKTISASYELEYGQDSLEMHEDAVCPGQRVVILDDLLATGGTVQANIDLVERLGGVVAGLAFLVELTEFPARDKLQGYPVTSIVQL